MSTLRAARTPCSPPRVAVTTQEKQEEGRWADRSTLGPHDKLLKDTKTDILLVCYAWCLLYAVTRTSPTHCSHSPLPSTSSADCSTHEPG